MAYDKTACSTLCDDAPVFASEGVTEEMCASLQNDTGLNPNLSVLQTNCESMNPALDCLIGRMDDLIETYSECDWKAFAHALLPNLYEMMKAMLCSECGLWTGHHDQEGRLQTVEQGVDNLEDAVTEAQAKADCSYQSTVNLIGAIDDSVGAQSFVRYYRDTSGTGTGYEWPLVAGADHTLDIYMDADLDNPGTQSADRDYVVICTNCLNFHHASTAEVAETYYSSGDTRPRNTIIQRQGMHPSIVLGIEADDWSWNLTTAVLIRKGEHIKLNTLVSRAAGTDPDYRVHQVVMAWIPISPAGGIDTSDVMAC